MAQAVGLVAPLLRLVLVSFHTHTIIGVVASVISNFVVLWRSNTSIDDTFDVFPGHGVGGMVGMFLTGIFASWAVNSANTTGNGLFMGKQNCFSFNFLRLS